ncbi:MAG: ribosome assembly cofactor RimP [Bacteroidales bacterium]|jgi:ribosome maturation factor RimP|nr:ribosome assembly cofactor RimP [Bacteroidales bacterium]
MIEKDKIVRITEQILSESQFLVDVRISSSNVIVVTIDSDTGVTIDDCIAVSKYIEGQLDRAEEDFELQVSSAGLGQPLKVLRQYRKNIGRELEVVRRDGVKLTGVLESVSETGIRLAVLSGTKATGRGATQPAEAVTVPFDEMKTAKNIVKF